VETKFLGRVSGDSRPLSIRLVASNPTGFVLKLDSYYEENDESSGRTVFRTLAAPDEITVRGAWDGVDVQTPYEVSQQFEKQRAEALAASDTLYVYDWPALFESAVQRLWTDFRNARSHHQSSSHAVGTLLLPSNSSSNSSLNSSTGESLRVMNQSMLDTCNLLFTSWFECRRSSSSKGIIRVVLHLSGTCFV
jgi:hypothetical protein